MVTHFSEAQRSCLWPLEVSDESRVCGTGAGLSASPWRVCSLHWQACAAEPTPFPANAPGEAADEDCSTWDHATNTGVGMELLEPDFMYTLRQQSELSKVNLFPLRTRLAETQSLPS